MVSALNEVVTGHEAGMTEAWSRGATTTPCTKEDVTCVRRSRKADQALSHDIHHQPPHETAAEFYGVYGT